jgi:hypothetical protein
MFVGMTGAPSWLVRAEHTCKTSTLVNRECKATLVGIGHLAALEDPGALAGALLSFYRTLDT